MSLERAAEILLIGHRLSDERLLHHECVENEITQKHTKREDEDCRVWSDHSRSRMLKIVKIHCLCNETIEESHQDTGTNSKDESLSVAFRVRSFLLHFS